MKTTIWSVLSDTKKATECKLFPSESAALDYIFTAAILPRLDEDKEGQRQARAHFDEDPYDCLESYKEEGEVWSHESHVVDLDDDAKSESQVPETPHVYTFHLKIFASVNIEANSEEEAIAMLENQHFESVNLGAFDNGEPILATVDDVEDSSGGPLGAVKVDGEEI